MKLVIDEASGVPFWRQARDDIARRIGAGELPPGSPLPSLRELAASSLVSGITVKRAYEELEAMGLVYSHQGRGTFVAAAGREAAREAAHTEVRAELAAVVNRGADHGMGADALRAAFEDALGRAFRSRG